MSLGPFSVVFPVNFVSGGDTTREAFRKHIHEIEKIYEVLNALNADKVSADALSGLGGTVGSLNTALTNHINSTTPHPNWKPSISWSDLTNKPNLADLNGNLPTSRLTGNLDTSRINGLQGFVENLLPDDSNDYIDLESLNEEGHLRFKNGFWIQWGVTSVEGFSATHNFPNMFNQCYMVIAQIVTDISPGTGYTVPSLLLVGWDTKKFQYKIISEGFTASQLNETCKISYIALGK